MSHRESSKPNTFIIGAPKCGTSAMAHYLNFHPNVFLCKPKEPFFWSEDYPGLRRIHQITNEERYLKLFRDATEQHSVVCEGSTNYLASKVAVEKILAFNPDARFLVMLRNPVDVVHAFHSEVSFSGIENEPDFAKAWKLQDERLAGRSLPANCAAPQFLQYRDVASYAPQLERFFDLVPASNREVIIFDDFAADNAKVFAETLQFLGLTDFEMESFEKVNASHGHKFPMLSKLVLDPPAPLKGLVETARYAARQFKGGWVDQAKHWFRKPTRREPLSAEFRDELCDFFADDIERTSMILNRELSTWTNSKAADEKSLPKEDSNEATDSQSSTLERKLVEAK